MDELKLSLCSPNKIFLCNSCRNILPFQGKTSPWWGDAGGNAMNSSWALPSLAGSAHTCPGTRLLGALPQGGRSGAATPGADLP